jgi:hypothetical protein
VNSTSRCRRTWLRTQIVLMQMRPRKFIVLSDDEDHTSIRKEGFTTGEETPGDRHALKKLCFWNFVKKFSCVF